MRPNGDPGSPSIVDEIRVKLEGALSRLLGSRVTAKLESLRAEADEITVSGTFIERLDLAEIGKGAFEARFTRTLTLKETTLRWD